MFIHKIYGALLEKINVPTTHKLYIIIVITTHM